MGNLDDMIMELLEMDIAQENSIVFSEESKELIHQIAEKCQNISVVEETRDQAEKYAEEMSAGEVYIDMLHKIVAAQTIILFLMYARLLFTVIDRIFREE